MEPHELAENIANEEEAICVCAEILRQWRLTQPEYARILDEIPDFVIKEYLREMRQMEKDHCETLSDFLKEQKAKSKQTEAMTLRERIIEELKAMKADPLMQKAPASIELIEDNYPEVVDYLSTEGIIAGLLLVLDLLDEKENNNTK